MQPNTIVLPVDLANNGTVVNQTFTRSEELVNRSTYRGPGNTLAVRNVAQLYRTLPKRTGAFLGACKTSVKFTRDITVLDAAGASVVAPLILELSFSVPVGASDADILALRQHGVAILDLDAVMIGLNSQAEI